MKSIEKQHEGLFEKTVIETDLGSCFTTYLSYDQNKVCLRASLDPGWDNPGVTVTSDLESILALAEELILKVKEVQHGS